MVYLDGSNISDIIVFLSPSIGLNTHCSWCTYSVHNTSKSNPVLQDGIPRLLSSIQHHFDIAAPYKWATLFMKNQPFTLDAPRESYIFVFYSLMDNLHKPACAHRSLEGFQFRYFNTLYAGYPRLGSWPVLTIHAVCPCRIRIARSSPSHHAKI